MVYVSYKVPLDNLRNNITIVVIVYKAYDFLAIERKKLNYSGIIIFEIIII
jgi:hypothetical protein